MTTPTRGQPESPTSRSRIRVSRSNIRSPLNTRGNLPMRLDGAESPSRSRQASPLTLPYVDLEAGKPGDRDISEEAVEMRTWSKGHADRVDDKVDEFGKTDVTPRRRTIRKSIPKGNLDGQAGPPSFARSEFETIVRHLRNRSPYKAATSKPKFPNNLDYAWQFAGWGQLSYLDLTKQDLEDAEMRLAVALDRPKLDQYRATSIAGNAVWGSVFYSLPAICAVADIYSPICMAVACSILFLFRPILLELGSAIRVDGASTSSPQYVYLLNFTAKGWALCAAAVTLIDAVATGVVSAATAASYIKGEVTLPFPDLVLTIIILGAFTGLLLFGIRESSSVTLGICALHCVTILILVITACVHWAASGSDVLKQNWQSSPSGGSNIARPEAYPAVLRNLIIGALTINISVLIVTYAVLPSDTIRNGANILSSVGQVAGGTWLRKVVVVDSAIVVDWCSNNVQPGGTFDSGSGTTCLVQEAIAENRESMGRMRTLPCPVPDHIFSVKLWPDASLELVQHGIHGRPILLCNMWIGDQDHPE
ncbi:hypothetical protein QFC21_001753 [Naganishia friedmannii]|uniref:Uncharacterized protein n=1 Tax=Naganishia friedmannii TaxID=89922 RepID=A0ACC2W0Y0_9TREE|nr:hypothetical protein QFC21_001753 [Naganishia friedmannii]